ncbi:MAG: MFS transporter [Candidatus Levybacteria bacterium]|nr:MFS transporter [Candidatus Levybacteria bacterium]
MITLMSIEKNIKLLTWFNFFTDFKLYAPVAILYFAQVSGSFALGMSIFSITMIATAIFEVPTGVFSDRIGRKKTVILGGVAAVLYSLFYAIGSSYVMLALGAVLQGLSRSFYSGNNDALLHDTLSLVGKREEYHYFLGRTSAMFQLALSISAVVGAVLASISFPLIMWLSVIPQVFCFLLSLQMVEPLVRGKESGNIFADLREAAAQFLHNRKLRLLSFSDILSYGFGESAYQFQAAFYNTVWPVWAIGIPKFLSNIQSMISFYFSGALIKRYSELKILVIGTLYKLPINVFLLGFPNVFSPILYSTNSFFYGVSKVAKNNLMQLEFTQQQRATMSSLNSLAGNLCLAVVAVSIGLVADRLGPAKTLLILQAYQLAHLWIFYKLAKYYRKPS